MAQHTSGRENIALSYTNETSAKFWLKPAMHQSTATSRISVWKLTK